MTGQRKRDILAHFKGLLLCPAHKIPVCDPVTAGVELAGAVLAAGFSSRAFPEPSGWFFRCDFPVLVIY